MYSICRVSKTERELWYPFREFCCIAVRQSSDVIVFLEIRVELFQEKGNQDTRTMTEKNIKCNTTKQQQEKTVSLITFDQKLSCRAIQFLYLSIVTYFTSLYILIKSFNLTLREASCSNLNIYIIHFKWFSLWFTIYTWYISLDLVKLCLIFCQLCSKHKGVFVYI